MNPEENSQDYNNQNYDYRQQHGPRQQYDYQQRPGNRRPVSGMSIAALILGSLSIVTCFCGIGGVIFGALGIIIALMSRGREPMQTNSKIGLGLSITGLALGILITVFLVAFGRYAASGYTKRYERYNEEIPYDYYEIPDGGAQNLPYSQELEDALNNNESTEI